MRVNGEVSFRLESEASFDAFGNPIPAENGEAISFPCLVSTIKEEIRIKDGGEFKSASYEVLIEEATIPSRALRLWRKGAFLGDFQAISIEALESVGRIKITV